ncbi:uncharacterized protein LOC111291747 isoform X2 [Durio zibethinus]|uniref:Uncharacterized protein LOC111291747 isoform X2 n=1 Tax=Durio zibethinus TaxID=66656 RepID=A0A6P5YGK8_DURZI|nr:uncharacterized protein LOC111291747 isoform X2 [Durio zibethinus]
MFGISYGELFLLIAATAALVGPKDLPKIARTVGRLAGRSIGYVQLARGQFDNVMQQTQARQVHKELQDTMAQLDAIRHEIRSLSLMNPGPMTRRLMESPPEPASDSNGTFPTEICEEVKNSADTAKKVHKELQDTMAQPDAIRQEIRSLSLMNPGPMTRRLIESPPEPASDSNAGTFPTEICEEVKNSADTAKKDYNSKSFASTDLHGQATIYARLAESEAVKAGSARCSIEEENLNHESVDFSVLPVSAESAGFLPDRKESAKGSDIVLEAVMEAEVARNAKDFFSLPQNQIQ